VTRRTKRDFHEWYAEQLLVAIRLCREACIRSSTITPICGEVYKACHELVEAIDRMVKLSPATVPTSMPNGTKLGARRQPCTQDHRSSVSSHGSIPW
jgi:hypothetical protein